MSAPTPCPAPSETGITSAQVRQTDAARSHAAVPDTAQPPTDVGVWHVRTVSGSAYTSRRGADGRLYVSADNGPTAYSRSLADGEWEIDPSPWPWPPVVGHPLEFRPPGGMDLRSPARVPGGGKSTSTVTSVRRVATAPGERLAVHADGSPRGDATA